MPAGRHTVFFAETIWSDAGRDLFRSSRERISQLVSPDFQVTRYNRTWRFSRPETRDDRFLLAKLGYSRPAEEEEARYDEELQDYVEEVAQQEEVNFCHFAIDLERNITAFEIRPPDIRRRSFTSNFEALAGEAGEDIELRVLEEELPFEVWISRLESLSEFQAKLRRPNPRWRDRTDTIRELIESTNADEVDLTAKVDDPEERSLEAEGSVIEESIEHQAAGYGEVSAHGYSQGREQEYSGNSVTRRAEVDVPEQATPETIFGQLVALLQELVL